MKLADLIDLEVQIAADETEDREILRGRDRAIFQSLAPAPSTTDPLLTAWLDALRRQTQTPNVGHRFVSGLRSARVYLTLFALVFGWATASGLLYFGSDRAPVNVGWFLVAIVGLQLLLLLVTLLGLPLARRYPRGPFINELRALINWFVGRFDKWTESSESKERWMVLKSRLRMRASLYSTVEKWLLLGITQTFGVAFNIGVLLGCLRLIAFTDIPFSWSTTLQGVDAAAVHQVTHVLSLPFAWFLPDAAPSLQLIEHTQYSRLLGRYVVQLNDAREVGGWWPFLVACVVTYGFLPRAILLAVSASQTRRALGNLPLSTVAVDRVVRRMRTATVRTAPEALAPQAAPPARDVESSNQIEVASSADVVLWRGVSMAQEAVSVALKHNFDVTVRQSTEATGAEALPELIAPFILLADAWEPPDKGVRRYLAKLRQAIGPQSRLTVALVGEPKNAKPTKPREEDFQIWEDRLTLLEDPYLAVESLEPAP